MHEHDHDHDRGGPGGTPVQDPHARAAEEVLASLGVDAGSGLSDEEAARRHRRYGPNRLRAARRRSVGGILVDQLKSTVILILAAAAGVALATGRFTEAAAIAAVVAVNAAIGFVSEWRAARSMDALRRLGQTRTAVRRGGAVRDVAASDLVPGDIVLCSGGDVVPADLRLLEVESLRVQEAALTGESAAVAKSALPTERDAGLAERTSMLFKGTTVVRGRATGVVTATGTATRLGGIAEMALGAEAEATPLQRRLDRLGRRLALVTFSTAAVVAGLGLLAGRPVVTMVETAIALGVAAIPEGLPIVATIALARGMWFMARRNAVVNRLPVVETLGATRVILTDKTGTVTENSMRLRVVVTAGGRHEPGPEALADETARCALEAVMLCTEVERRGGEWRGDPTEVALVEGAEQAGLERDELTRTRPEVRRVPFDSDVMMMATFHRGDEGIEAAVKGAPERVLARCTAVVDSSGDRAFDDGARRLWEERARELAGEGLRLLAVAERRGIDEDAEPFEDLRLLGLVGLLDPPREGVRPALDECRRAGLRVVMVTGDRPETAVAVARQAGLVDADAVTDAVSGAGMGAVSDLGEDDRRRLLEATVFARVTPEQKLGLVRLLQESGEIVAMTGDGVNDAPALKKADIGIAMGRRGTEAARQVADMVLRDDAFSTIVAAVREGRVIFSNIRRAVLFMLCTNGAEVAAVAAAALLDSPLPLLPLQILFLNVVTDVFPALALAVGTGGPRVMQRPPRPRDEPVLTAGNWRAVAGWSVVLAGCVLSGLWLASGWLGMDRLAAVTVSFMVLAFGKLWFVLNLRERGSGLLDNDVVRNPWIWAAVALCVALLVAAVHVPWLAGILRTRPLAPREWGLVMLLSMVPAVLGQALRAWQARTAESPGLEAGNGPGATREADSGGGREGAR